MSSGVSCNPLWRFRGVFVSPPFVSSMCGNVSVTRGLVRCLVGAMRFNFRGLQLLESKRFFIFDDASDFARDGSVR